jgi:hypothetical protein
MHPRHGWFVKTALLWVVTPLAGILLDATGRAGEWTLPDNRLGIRTAPLLLLSRPEVDRELKLERSQILGARRMIDDLTRRAVALRGKTGAAVIAERRMIDEAQLQWLSRNLTGNQLERLRQIELQWEGAGAMLSRPRVAEYLRLTPEQRQGLARVVTERNAAKMRGLTAPADEPAFNERAQSLLSAAQRELWVNLLGAPVTFATTGVPARNRDQATQQAGFAREQR